MISLEVKDCILAGIEKLDSGNVNDLNRLIGEMTRDTGYIHSEEAIASCFASRENSPLLFWLKDLFTDWLTAEVSDEARRYTIPELPLIFIPQAIAALDYFTSVILADKVILQYFPLKSAREQVKMSISSVIPYLQKYGVGDKN